MPKIMPNQRNYVKSSHYRVHPYQIHYRNPIPIPDVNPNPNPDSNAVPYYLKKPACQDPDPDSIEIRAQENP